MRPVEMLEGTVEGDLGGTKINMGLDEDSLPFIMGILTNMYKDLTLAIVREYPCNARDSHIEAGKADVPIVVTTPTELDPYFRVKDFGVGLSLDDVINVYSRYAASTKRNTDDQTGMFGIGSKSALAYAPQFVVTAVKDGWKSQIVVQKEQDGSGVMEVLSHDPTDEENGVEVVIPIKYGSDIAVKAQNFFRFWKPGTVLLNGEDPSGFGDSEITYITDDILVSRNVVDQDYVVMGNVAYPCGSDLAGDIFGGRNNYGRVLTNVVAYVKMGAVVMAPDRERMADTPRTKQTIELIRDEIKRNLHDKIKQDVASAPDEATAIQRYQKWLESINKASMPKDLKWHGHEIATEWGATGVRFDPDSKRYASYTVDEWTYAELTQENAMVVKGYNTDATPNTMQKRKIRKYIEDNVTGYVSYVYLFDEVPGSPWTDKVSAVEWDDINKIKFPRDLSGVGGGAQPILQFDVTRNYWVPITEVDDQANIIFLSPAEKIANSRIKTLIKYTDDAVVLKLGKNRWNKLQRLFPNAKYFAAAWSGIQDVIKAKITDDEREAWTLDKSEIRLVEMLDDANITVDDPIFDEVRRLGKIDTSNIEEYNKIAYSPINDNKHLIEKVYPLTKHVSTYYTRDLATLNELAFYMNAKYQQRER